MTRFTSRRAVAALLPVLLAPLAQPEAAGPDPAPIIVRVYDQTVGNGRARATAIRSASAILADTGIAVEWTDCSRGSPMSACTGLRGPRDVVVRIVPVAATAAPGSLIKDQSRLPLGFAVVDPVVGAAAIATIFLDQVQPLAWRTGVDQGRLLGRAIAHELGHLLFRSNVHSGKGLMRETWTDVELTRNRPEDWVFAPSDAARLRGMTQTGPAAGSVD